MIKVIDVRKEIPSPTERNVVFIKYDNKSRVIYQTIVYRFKTTGQAEYYNGMITRPYGLI